MTTTLRTEHLSLPEDCQKNIIFSILHLVWNFYPLIHKVLEGIKARSQHPSLADRSFQILCFPGTEQSANYEDHSSISGSEHCCLNVMWAPMRWSKIGMDLKPRCNHYNWITQCILPITFACVSNSVVCPRSTNVWKTSNSSSVPL